MVAFKCDFLFLLSYFAAHNNENDRKKRTFEVSVAILCTINRVERRFFFAGPLRARAQQKSIEMPKVKL